MTTYFISKLTQIEAVRNGVIILEKEDKVGTKIILHKYLKDSYMEGPMHFKFILLGRRKRKERHGIFRNECFLKGFTHEELKKFTHPNIIPCRMSLYVFGVDGTWLFCILSSFFYFFLYKQKWGMVVFCKRTRHD